MTMNKEENKKSVVTTLREVRDKINLEIQDLSIVELKEYFRKKITLYPAKYIEFREEKAFD